MADDCIELYRRWAGERAEACSEDIYCHMLGENQKVHELFLRYHQQLGLTGRVVMIDNEIKAYSLGHPVNENMFCVLCEIADPKVKGLPTFMFREFCRDKTLEAYTFINVMDDFEMGNIQKTKMSFRPSVLLPSYIVMRDR